MLSLNVYFLLSMSTFFSSSALMLMLYVTCKLYAVSKKVDIDILGHKFIPIKEASMKTLIPDDL